MALKRSAALENIMNPAGQLGGTKPCWTVEKGKIEKESGIKKP